MQSRCHSGHSALLSVAQLGLSVDRSAVYSPARVREFQGPSRFLSSPGVDRHKDKMPYGSTTTPLGSDPEALNPAQAERRWMHCLVQPIPTEKPSPSALTLLAAERPNPSRCQSSSWTLRGRGLMRHNHATSNSSLLSIRQRAVIPGSSHIWAVSLVAHTRPCQDPRRGKIRVR
jgi:hypothetical protein